LVVALAVALAQAVLVLLRVPVVFSLRHFRSASLAVVVAAAEAVVAVVVADRAEREDQAEREVLPGLLAQEGRADQLSP
jgi:hypothetical protein